MKGDGSTIFAALAVGLFVSSASIDWWQQHCCFCGTDEDCRSDVIGEN